MKKITLESLSPSQCYEFGMIYSCSVPDPNFQVILEPDAARNPKR
jgi:hypothetical protein